MIDQAEPRRPSAETTWKAHLDRIDKRNADARKQAAERRSPTERAAVARSRLLKGD